MENKKLTFVGNGRENPTGNIINLQIMVDKIPKEAMTYITSRNGNKHKMLFVAVKRKTDKDGNHILDDFGNSHFVCMDDWKINKEKEKALNPDPL